jgi:hypothetical protein
MARARGIRSTANTGWVKGSLPAQHQARKRFFGVAVVVCLPLAGMLSSMTALDSTTPATAALRPNHVAAFTSATTTSHKPPRLTVAERRAAARQAARRRHEAARRRRERLRQKKHAASRATPAPLVQSTSSGPEIDTNIAPNPDFLVTCQPTDDTLGCISQEIAAIDNAQIQEGLQPITINVAALTELSPADQMFVLTDLERATRGLPPVEAMTAQLDAVATKGAVQMTDPALAGWTLTGGKGAIAWDSNWAGGLNTVGSDYFWLYSDGEGYNIDCTPTDQSGCFEHEENVLAPLSGTCNSQRTLPQMVMGAGVAMTAEYGPSEAEIIVQECGGLPSDIVFTWSEAEQFLGISAS